MAAEDEVRQASDRFYAALTALVNGDTGPMGAVWAHSADVTAMHPIGEGIGEREVGWEQVWSVWRQVASLASGGQVRLRDQLIRVGTELAYEVGKEGGEVTLAGERVQLNNRVTNIYRHEGGEWKIVHHHADAAPEMEAAVDRLQPPPQ